MQSRKIIIIGSGIGGLAAGVYGQLNGYHTEILESHVVPGGQCAAWKRKGYTFDGCIHHLFGCAPTSAIYDLWQELGAVPREFVPLQECVSVLTAEDTLFRDYYDTDMLESHMNELAPYDHRAIRDYIEGIRVTARSDAMGRMMVGSTLDMVTAAPSFVRSWRWLRPSMGRYAERFANPTLRNAMPLLVYTNPAVPLIVHLVRHAYGLTGALQWPVGGALEFARSIERRYKSLGGTVHYKARVSEILTEGDKAVGVKLDDGIECRADVVISNADGRRTIMEMLGGRYVDERVRGYCEPADDEMQFAVQVFLGVNRDLSHEPSSMIIQMVDPIIIANHTCNEIELQTYGFDPSMAPEGKGVIKVELYSQYSYWSSLAGEGRSRYVEAKQEVADQVIDLLERRYFTGLRQQVETVDVATLLTWERYTGGSKGLGIYPRKKISIMGSVLGKSQGDMLPGLQNFRFVGTWATGGGALFTNAVSGKRVIQSLCKQDGRKFVASGDKQ